MKAILHIAWCDRVLVLATMILMGWLFPAVAAEGASPMEAAAAAADERPVETPVHPDGEVNINPPEQPALEEPVIAFLPPLSLRDCLALLDRGVIALPGENKQVAANQVPVASLGRLIRSCNNYLQYRDDLHTSLAHYTWIELADERVQNDPDETDRDTIEFTPTVKRISALSIEARNGDVWLHRIQVYDENGNERGDFIEAGTPRLLRHSLPRRQVFHLWRRTTISRIELEYSQASVVPAGDPVVVIYGGSTTRPEYIKMAIYHLTKARTRLASQQWYEARKQLEEARLQIDRYLKESGE